MLRVPIPACLAIYIPELGDNNTNVYSYYKQQSSAQMERRPGNNPKKSDLRRNKSLPETGFGYDGRCDSPCRVKMEKSPCAVRFTSMGSYPSTPQNLTPDR